MSKINITLHTIFRHLASDENFLSTVVETSEEETKNKKNKQKGFNLMQNMVTEYNPLSPYEVQEYNMLPHKVKSFLTPDYARYGIKNITEKNFAVINVSFLNSLNILLRPEIYKLNIEEHMHNLSLLEGFVRHKIHRNFQIDKIKNTKKVQAQNIELINNMLEGKISHDLIQCIINIFEINLLVFDFTKMEMYFYWTKGTKYPFFNPFKNIHCMSYVHGNYEPIMTPNNCISEEQKRKIYLNILTNLNDIKCQPQITMGLHSLLYINTWSIPSKQYLQIVETFFTKKTRSIKDCYNDLLELDK